MMNDVDLIYYAADELEKIYIGIIRNYLTRLRNFQTIGRAGLFRYDNSDYALLTGIYAARNFFSPRGLQCLGNNCGGEEPKRKKGLTKTKRYRYNIQKKRKNTKVKFPFKNQSIRWIKKKGIVVLLNPKKGKYYRLNETSSLIWDLSDGTRNEEEITHIVKEKFDAKNPRSVKNDVKGIVSDLHRKQLILLKKRRNKKIYGIWS